MFQLLTGAGTFNGRFVVASWFALLAGIMLGLVAGHSLQAHAAPANDWQQTGLTEPTSEFSIDSDGTMIARTGTGRLRSEDGGATWSSVPVSSEIADDEQMLDRVTYDPTDP